MPDNPVCQRAGKYFGLVGTFLQLVLLSWSS